MNSSLLRKFAMPALLLGSLFVTGCAGMHVGPGTTTGAAIGGAASILNGDGGRAAIIGTGIGAAVDILSGERPIEIETHRGDRYHRDDRYYRDDRYHRDDRYYRPAPPPRRHQHRRFYDHRCGCYYQR